MSLLVASHRVRDLVDFPFITAVDDRRLWFRWQLAGGRRCIVVEEREVENIVLPDRIRKVKFVRIFFDHLTYYVQSCPFVIQVL
jgi:hypothetical protein